MINALFHRLLLPSVIQLAVYFKEEFLEVLLLFKAFKHLGNTGA